MFNSFMGPFFHALSSQLDIVIFADFRGCLLSDH